MKLLHNLVFNDSDSRKHAPQDKMHTSNPNAPSRKCKSPVSANKQSVGSILRNQTVGYVVW